MTDLDQDNMERFLFIHSFNLIYLRILLIVNNEINKLTLYSFGKYKKVFAYCWWFFCVNEKISMSSSGVHTEKRFKIAYNFF